MRLLFATHTPAQASGSGIYLRRIAEACQAAGHTCALLTPVATGSGHAIELHRLGTGTVDQVARAAMPFPTFSGHRDSTLLYSQMTGEQQHRYATAWTAAIRQACLRTQPDLIHVNHLFLIAATVARTVDTPYVVVSHGSEFFREPGDRFAAEQRFAAEHAAAVVGITPGIAERAAPPGPPAPAIPPGFDPAVFRPHSVDRTAVLRGFGVSGERPCVAYAGRIVGYKRVTDLIRAMALIDPRQRPDLMVVGDGAALDSVRATARSHDVPVAFAAHRDDPAAVADLLAAVDLVVLPSENDPYPMAIVEALACGTPVLVSDQCGVTDIVGDAVFPLGDTATLARLITRAVTEDWKSTRGPQGPARVAALSWPTIATRLIEVYRRAAMAGAVR
jgi:glycosyltransferase involved in cell wall biosynthesis